ncbi:hypothetical protein [Tateyamaria sp. syn59]|uniref:hypothetical protein n=1 Tax=Tateyamaria sp. syn59 TaxID=2576942 RepID=UPI0011BF62A5|nr:hypothetical protein [Tateyamaria sp. syn59]
MRYIQRGIVESSQRPNLLGILILAAVIAAAAAVIALLLGGSWWLALAIYAGGGTVLTFLFAWIIAKRNGSGAATDIDDFMSPQSATDHLSASAGGASASDPQLKRQDPGQSGGASVLARKADRL